MVVDKENLSVSLLRWHLYRKYRNAPRDRFKGCLLRLRMLVNRLAEGELVVDCGANVGDVTEYFLRNGLNVVAFEPDPLAQSELRKRFRDAPNLTIEAKAVGTSNCRTPLFRTPGAQSGTLPDTAASSLYYRQEIHADASPAEVEVIDLIEFLNSLPAKVRILKLDIEGSEADILEQLLECGLYQEIDLIVVETHERFSPELSVRIARIRERLKEEGISNVCLDWL
jgi:FkbM family methyltransferase